MLSRFVLCTCQSDSAWGGSYNNNIIVVLILCTEISASECGVERVNISHVTALNVQHTNRITKYGTMVSPHYNCTFGKSQFQFQYAVNLRSSKIDTITKHVIKKLAIYILVKGVKLTTVIFQILHLLLLLLLLWLDMRNSPTRQD